MAKFLKNWFRKKKIEDIEVPAEESVAGSDESLGNTNETAKILEALKQRRSDENAFSDQPTEAVEVGASSFNHTEVQPPLSVNKSFDEETKLIIESLNSAAPENASEVNSVDASGIKEDLQVPGDEKEVEPDAPAEEDSAASGAGVVARLRASFKTKKVVKQGKPSGKFSLKRLLGIDDTAVGAIPIRVLIGYLPDVLERDVMEYAIGIAEKNFDQLAIVYYDSFKYEGGYIYEIHEGGSGKAFIPEIIEYFDSFGDFDPASPATVVLRTATRKVEVQKLRQGLVAVLLPESSTIEPSEFLKPKTSLTPAFNQRTGFFVISAMFFIVTFLAMVVAALVRYQPYEETIVPPAVKMDSSKMPSSQWKKIVSNVDAGKAIKALKFKDGKWDLVTADAAPTPAPEEQSGGPGASKEGAASAPTN